MDSLDTPEGILWRPKGKKIISYQKKKDRSRSQEDKQAFIKYEYDYI